MQGTTTVIRLEFLLVGISMFGARGGAEEALNVERSYLTTRDQLRTGYEAGRNALDRLHDSRVDSLRAWRDLQTARSSGYVRDQVSHNYYFQRLLADLERSRLQGELRQWYGTQQAQLERQIESARLQCEARQSTNLFLLFSQLAVPSTSRVKAANSPPAKDKPGDIWEQLRRYTR